MMARKFGFLCILAGTFVLDIGEISAQVATDVQGSRCVDTADIEIEAISTGRIRGGAVTTPKIADGAVTESKIGVRAVTNSRIAIGAVRAGRIADGAVGESKLSAAMLERIIDVETKVGRCGTSYRFVGFTASTVADGTIGVPAMNTACQADYGPTARMAVDAEFFSSPLASVPSTPAWIWQDAVSSGNGQRHCYDWTRDSCDTFGGGVAVNDINGGTGFYCCTDTHRVACSALNSYQAAMSGSHCRLFGVQTPCGLFPA